MVFRERRPMNADSERQSLLFSRHPDYKARNWLTTFNWKSVTLGIVAGLVPFLLWLASKNTQEKSSNARFLENRKRTHILTRVAKITFSFDTLVTQDNGDLQIPENSLLQLAPVQETVQGQQNAAKSIGSSNGEKAAASPDHPPLKSIMSSPNWKKISTKSYRKHNNSSVTDVHAPTEFGTYPQPTFTQAGNKTIATYHLVVTKGVFSPDGFPQPAFLINGQSPGPEIRVQQNSILVVNVHNKLDTALTIHFHGIHQRKSFLSDGVPHVTQNPIPPGGSFTYKMNLWPQTGTYFYHAHTGMDIIWLYGPLIIEDMPEIYNAFPEEYHFEEDRVFILNGVYHNDVSTLMDRLIGPVHNYPDLISSVTINGRSFGEWTNNITGEVLSAPTACGYDITSVKKGMTYRFRFINAASDSLLSCNISSHTFHVVETDGIYTKPVKTDHVAISPGQRYSIIIKMDQEDDNYYISCKHMESRGPLNGLAVLNYLNATKPNKEMLEFYRNGSETLIMDRWIIDELGPNYDLNQTDVYHVPINVDKEHVIDVLEAVYKKKHVYLINGHAYEDPKVPYFQQLKQGINITDEPQVFEMLEGETIQFVFQNTRKGRFCFSHPWHAHGHDFHVVGEGPDKYDPVVDGARIQKDVESGKEFQFRDAVTVYANQTVGELIDGAYCGWAAIRFSAHNNGLWLFHCHVTPHLVMGKKFVLWEHSKEDPMLTQLMATNPDYKLPGQPGGW